MTTGAAVVGSAGATGTALADYAQSEHSLSATIGCASQGSQDEIVYANWDWDSSGSGEEPVDVVGIYWDDDKWELVTANYSTADNVYFVETKFNDGSKGVEFRHEDWNADSSSDYSAASKLRPKGDYDEDVRNVFVKYTHTYKDVNIEDVSVGQDGGDPEWTVTVSSNDKKWEKGAETDHAASSCGGGGL